MFHRFNILNEVYFYLKEEGSFNMDIKEVAKKYADYQINMRRYFHENPELSEKEFNTSKVVKEELDKIGVPWVPCGLETGVLATIKGSKPGKTILPAVIWMP